MKYRTWILWGAVPGNYIEAEDILEAQSEHDAVRRLTLRKAHELGVGAADLDLYRLGTETTEEEISL